MTRFAHRILIVAPMAALAACTTTRTASLPPVISHNTPPVVAQQPSRPMVVPNPVYKVGEPYQVGGIWYYPREQADYDETGIASWYGVDYDGKLTANGELFDHNRVSAAHTTLPMPVNVRITNLENGRSLVVRVNDRGPYIPGRIIDVSEHTADLLGFRLQGLARVRVSYLGKADLNGPGLAPLAEETPVEIATAVPAAPVAEVESAPLAPVAGAKVAPPPVVMASVPKPVEQSFAPTAAEAADGQVTEVPVPAVTALYVQAGAYISPMNAKSVADRLKSAGAHVSRGVKDGRPIYRVRIGPFQAVDQADAALAQVLALGQIDVQIVVDSAAS